MERFVPKRTYAKNQCVSFTHVHPSWQSLIVCLG